MEGICSAAYNNKNATTKLRKFCCKIYRVNDSTGNHSIINIQVRRFPHHLPYIAHKKLVSVVHTPYPVIFHTHTVPVPIRIYSRVRPSVIAAELQRIRDLPRSSNVSYVSRYLNSRDSIVSFKFFIFKI